MSLAQVFTVGLAGAALAAALAQAQAQYEKDGRQRTIT